MDDDHVNAIFVALGIFVFAVWAIVVLAFCYWVGRPARRLPAPRPPAPRPPAPRHHGGPTIAHIVVGGQSANGSGTYDRSKHE